MMDPQWNTTVQDAVLSLRDLLRNGQERLVIVESCTAGLVAALLGQVPGISEFLCGSMVVYQTPIKHEWLGISSEELADPRIGPVSARVTEELAKAILKRTPEATLAASVTGHLGPNAPNELDGLVYCSFASKCRNPNSPEARSLPDTVTMRFQLKQPVPADENDLAGRRSRQYEAAIILMHHIRSCLQRQA